MVNNSRLTCYAHSANGKGAGRDELMVEHVAPVADRSLRSATWFFASDEMKIAAFLHDIGKYTWKFQQRLLDPANVTGVDHWTLGEQLALKQYGQRGIAIACIIAGHHIGLKSPKSLVRKPDVHQKILEQVEKLGEKSVNDIVERFVTDGFQLAPFGESIYDPIGNGDVAQMLNIRMLFSSLVDADFIETEAHFAGDSVSKRTYRPDGDSLEIQATIDGLTTHISRRSKASVAVDDVNRLRQLLSESCGRQNQKQGIYTLTAPTGTGKTLAMLRFALQYAKDRESSKAPIRRIISVLPFLSIIEQTANDYSQVLANVEGEFKLVQDHSLSEQRLFQKTGDDGIDESMHTRKLLAQNWDAPFVVTTTVQFFESLFADRPSKCRKLHNISNSVILLDEVQTLPPKLLIATLAAVSQLVERFNCTVVFATATQPAFEHLGTEIAKQCPAGWQTEELNEHRDEMYEVTSTRTRVNWRLDQTISWANLAKEIVSSDEKHVLAVVNLKRHAKRLTEELEKLVEGCDVFHMSTNLCPAHRKSVIDEINARLQDNNRPVYLVATQCIEAGVDISFQKAYRALAPLESIAQVAGRCNRGGEYGAECEVVVFVPAKQSGEKSLYPPGYQAAADATRAFVLSLKPEQAEKVIHRPDEITRYYRTLYDLTKNTKPKKEFAEAIYERDFERVANHYRLIATDTVRVLVPFDQDVFDRLNAEDLSDQGIHSIREWVAAATPLSISIQRSQGLNATGLQPVWFRKTSNTDTADWYVLIDPEKYDCGRLGLLDLESSWIC
jgi:CRISPR-associated helicase Cas3/CRISPR-associated endonuclease Cas3-HD